MDTKTKLKYSFIVFFSVVFLSTIVVQIWHEFAVQLVIGAVIASTLLLILFPNLLWNSQFNISIFTIRNNLFLHIFKIVLQFRILLSYSLLCIYIWKCASGVAVLHWWKILSDFTPISIRLLISISSILEIQLLIRNETFKQLVCSVQKKKLQIEAVVRLVCLVWALYGYSHSELMDSTPIETTNQRIIRLLPLIRTISEALLVATMASLTLVEIGKLGWEVAMSTGLFQWDWQAVIRWATEGESITWPDLTPRGWRILAVATGEAILHLNADYRDRAALRVLRLIVFACAAFWMFYWAGMMWFVFLPWETSPALVLVGMLILTCSLLDCAQSFIGFTEVYQRIVQTEK